MGSSRVRQTLLTIGAITQGDVERISERTRDREVPVYRDSKTGVVFLDAYPGDDEYLKGDYHEFNAVPDFDDVLDTQRRTRDFLRYYSGLSVVDFGCGAGHFLAAIKDQAATSTGVELQASFRDLMASRGISSVATLSEVTHSIDSVFMFHVLEHLPDPLPVLEGVAARLREHSGALVVEVPSADDYLLTTLGSRAFQDFTLWSYHLVLHTRQSLRLLLRAAGFTHVDVWGVQRFGIANHLGWLAYGRPTGNRSPLSAVETPELRRAYEQALSQLGQTDTLIAVARPGP